MAGPSSLSKILASDLRLVRQARGKTIEEVATKIGLDVSELSRLERGLRPLTPDLEIRLLRVFFAPQTVEREPPR